jgi:endonuclease/exonuclease/phosphatase family metal-dependent hydrolase
MKRSNGEVSQRINTETPREPRRKVGRVLSMIGGLAAGLLIEGYTPQSMSCQDVTYGAPSVPAERLLSVTTYNIASGRRDLNGVIAAINKKHSQIVALQEATDTSLAAIGQATGMRYAVTGWTLRNAHRTYGEAILSTLPIQSGTSYSLPSGNLEPREMLVAEIKIDNKPVAVADIHTVSKDAGIQGSKHNNLRQEQVATAMHILGNYRGKDIFLAGDINASEDSEVYRTVTRAGFVDSTPAVTEQNVITFTGALPPKHLDYVFAKSQRFSPEVVAVGGGAASDHCELTSVFADKNYQGDLNIDLIDFEPSDQP